MKLDEQPKHSANVLAQEQIVVAMDAIISDVAKHDLQNITQLELTHPSRFELLPIEIKQEIYSYLGFPVARVAWLNPWEVRSCEYLHWAAKNPNAISKDGMMRLTKIQFTRPLAHKENIIIHGTDLRTGKPTAVKTRHCPCDRKCRGCTYKNCPCGKICDYCASQKPFRYESSMMILNKRIHGELCGMLYSGVAIEFGFELSKRKVHYVENEWRTKGRRHIGHNRHRGIGADSMVMTDLTMAYLTHISLDTNVGLRNTTLTPSHTRDFYKRVLRRQGDTICFIADHCTRLVSLKYSPNLVAFEKCKQYSLARLATSFNGLFNSCGQLEILEIEAIQHYRGCGGSEAIARLGSTKINVNETMTKDELAEAKWAGEDQWAMNVLLNIRERDDLLIDCPGLADRHGRRHGP